MIPCKHCSSSGIYVDYCGYPIGYWPSTGTIHTEYKFIDCEFCGGKGWIDEDEIIPVPRKYIKDAYFKNK